MEWNQFKTLALRRERKAMKIEFKFWPGNTEIMLIDCQNDSDEIEAVVRSFYTSARHLEICSPRGNRDGLDAEEAFALLEDQLPPPHISGCWAEFHPAIQRYNEKHKQK